MATTSIWAVKGWLGKVVLYIENPEKTENPQFYRQKNMTDVQVQNLSDVIDYAARPEKTTAALDSESLLGPIVWLQPVEDDAQRTRLWQRIVAGDRPERF